EPGQIDYVPDPRAVIARGTDAAGNPILVRVYGRDALHGSLLGSAWDRLWYRRGPASVPVGRQLQAEHEAFVTLFAERAGAAVQPSGKDTLLVRGDGGRRFCDLPAAEATPAAASAAWRALAALHDAGIAHGGLSPSTVYLLDDGTVLLSDLSAAVTSPEPSDL